jgi:hypothetical protein
LKAGNGWSGQNGHGEQCDQREEQEKPAGHAGKLPAADVLVNPEDWSGLLRSPGTRAETPWKVFALGPSRNSAQISNLKFQSDAGEQAVCE